MERKIIKLGRGKVIFVPPVLLELIKSDVGDYVKITYNDQTKKIEVSKRDRNEK